jgi:hypothetical protein
MLSFVMARATLGHCQSGPSDCKKSSVCARFACRLIPKQPVLVRTCSALVRRTNAPFLLTLFLDDLLDRFLQRSCRVETPRRSRESKASLWGECLPTHISIRLNGGADRHSEPSKHNRDDSATVSALQQVRACGNTHPPVFVPPTRSK